MGSRNTRPTSNNRPCRQRRRRRRQCWRQLATAAVAASSCALNSCCSAFLASSSSVPTKGPLHTTTRLHAVMEAPTLCQLDGGVVDSMSLSKMFVSGVKTGTSTFSAASDRYGGHASRQEEQEEQQFIGFRLEEDNSEQTVHPTYHTRQSSPLKNQLASNIWRRRQVSSELPAWFPWLPSKIQIEMLKVTELKEACGERSLKKTGNKLELQTRLWEWTQQQHQQRIENARGSGTTATALDMGLSLKDAYSTRQQRNKRVGGSDKFRSRKQPLQQHSRFKRDSRDTASPPNKHQGSSNSPKKYDSIADSLPPPLSSSDNEPAPDSLADWARNLDLQPLLNRRRDIRRQAQEGKKKKPRQYFKKPDMASLTEAFEAPPSLYSNLEVKQMYAAAKEADQVGDRVLAKSILLQLQKATPHDARIFRRLARMATEEGKVDEARKHLQEGLRLHPQNGFLWHGLGQLELKANKSNEARRCFQKAIAADPTLPHPYHALGTLEHSHGRIASAMKVLKEGIRNCPKNHRLHHALGDLYREAKLLEMAETSYRRSLEYGSPVNHGFAYTALAYVAYEKGSMDECRNWLQEAVSLNDGRNSRSWVAWGQMEEAQGDIHAARAVYVQALAQYEHGLIQRNNRKRGHGGNKNNGYERSAPQMGTQSLDPSHNKGSAISSLKTKLLKRVPSYRSGDKFINVYRNWARLEERYGDEDAVNAIYTRATTAFPRNHQLVLKWAQYQAKLGHDERARELFEEACQKVSNWHADPYREYGEFEMSLGNYAKARSILYRGAQAMSLSSDGGLGNRGGMAQLFHTWAVCEWYLDNLGRAEVLFDHALRLTGGGHDGSKIRSYILFSIARLEYYRGEYELAQHCVALCLKENVMPGGNSKTWALWADIAKAMGNDDLAKECTEQADIVRKDEENGGVESLSRLLGLTRPGRSLSDNKTSSRGGPDMQHLMRRDPWNHKIFGQTKMVGGFDGVKLPDMPKDVNR